MRGILTLGMNDSPAASIYFWFASLTIARVRDDRDVGQLVGRREGLDDRQHDPGLCLVPPWSPGRGGRT
jgi:hypothetical protein